MEGLKGKRVLVTGVGIKPLGHVFRDIVTNEPSHTSIKDSDTEYKGNIGAAVALECAQAGAIVHIVSRSVDKLKIIKSWIEKEVPGASIEYAAVDLSNKDELQKLVDSIPTDLPLYWVQSVGLGAGTVKIKDDNPYLPIEEIPEELVEAELSVLTNTIELLQLLLPRFRKQQESRVCIISSMSAIRSITSGSIHNAAKGAISRFANAASIELFKDHIYVTDVRPGGVDTGLYDSEVVQKTAEKIAQTYNTDWSKSAGGLRLMPPTVIGEQIASILSAEGHVTSVNIVARGQWPHEGS